MIAALLLLLQAAPPTVGDTVWLSRLFGNDETDPLWDPDFDFDGDGWIDGSDLAYLASNLGKCWSGTGWTAQACN